MVCLLVAPVWVRAADAPSDTEIEMSAGSTSATAGVQFDPSKNIIGNPDNDQKLSVGSVLRLTYLSGASDPLSITINVINVALSFLGLTSLIMMLYAGLKWFFARENEEEATKAKEIIIGAVIGLVITLGSYGIVQLLFSQFTIATAFIKSIIPIAYADSGVTIEPATLPFDPSKASGGYVAVTRASLVPITGINLGKTDPLSVTINVVNILLSLLATAFLGLMLYTGGVWVWARGNEEIILRARDTLFRAVLGLVIVLGAYGIAELVFTLISQQTT